MVTEPFALAPDKYFSRVFLQCFIVYLRHRVDAISSFCSVISGLVCLIKQKINFLHSTLIWSPILAYCTFCKSEINKYEHLIYAMHYGPERDILNMFVHIIGQTPLTTNK